MLSFIQEVLSKNEIKKELGNFYLSMRFLIIQILYYGGLSIYIFIKSMQLINLDANPFIATFYVLLIGVTWFKIFLCYKKEVKTVFPSLMLLLYFPEEDQHFNFFIFILNPLSFLVLYRSLKSSTNFVSERLGNDFLNITIFYILPIILEMFMFIFLLVIFGTADVVADKMVITAEQEKELEKEDADCLICKCEFEKDEVLTILKCRHKFHDDCITTWFKFNNACPLCKQTVLRNGSLREIVSKYSN